MSPLRQLNKKIVLIGDPAVGKTSLVRRFVQNEFDDKYIASIGVKVSKKPMAFKFGGIDVQLDMMIFDVLGQHDFHRLRRMYVDGSDAALLVCDLSRLDTIESIESFWYPEMEKIVGKIPMIIIGNKSDLAQEGSDGISLLKAVSRILLLPTQLCSAKTGTGVEDAFSKVGHEVLEKHFQKEMPITQTAKIENLHMAADAIIAHYCEQQDNKDAAIETCAVVFKEAGFNIKEPTAATLVKAVELLFDKEKPLIGDERALRNKEERLRYLSGL
ncbi:MAG: Rab family GTPase [Thermoplasmata archaeon]